MSAPLARGLIIAASVLVAAGVAVYENEQIRRWLDENRRRIALALHALGDEIQPGNRSQRPNAPGPRPDWSSSESNRSRRESVIRRNRLDMIRKAREEGVAVDLDELVALGAELEMDQQRKSQPQQQQPLPPQRSLADSSRGFDRLVGEDGMLRRDIGPTTSEMTERSSTLIATGSRLSDNDATLRRRPGPGMRGLDAGAAFGNPFDDEAQVLFDQSLIGAEQDNIPSANMPGAFEPAGSQTPRASQQNQCPLIDIPVLEPLSTDTSYVSRYKTDDELEAEISEAIRRSLQDVPSDFDQQIELATARSLATEPMTGVEATSPPSCASSEPPFNDSLYDSLYSPPTPPRHEPSPPVQQQPAPEDLMDLAEPLQPCPPHPVGMDPLFPIPSVETPRSATVSAEPEVSILGTTALQNDNAESEPADDESMVCVTPGSATPEALSPRPISPSYTLSPAPVASPTAAHHHHAPSSAGSVAGSSVVAALSDVASLPGMDTDYEDDSYSFVTGTNTPGSWTDVESVAEGEEDDL